METMLPRERVLAALAHKATDRVPLDFWAVPEMIEKLKQHFGTPEEEQVMVQLGVDIRLIQPDYIGPEITVLDDGSYFDQMGVHRRIVHNEYCAYEEYASAPLGFAETVEDLASYSRWPDIEQLDFHGLSRKIGNAHNTYYIKLETGGLFEFAWALRGYEQFMMDMVLEPEIAHYIMNRLTEYFCEYVRRAMESAGDQYDMVYTYDDIATQSTLLMSKEMWSTFVRPYHERLNAVIHSYGKTVMYHSCGAVYEMIDSLRQLPIDVLNPIQPRATGIDMGKIKAEFGSQLSFHGGIDIQFVLPSGTTQEVAEAVRHSINTLGKGGGYILTSAHYIQADTPVENVIAMYQTARSLPVHE